MTQIGDLLIDDDVAAPAFALAAAAEIETQHGIARLLQRFGELGMPGAAARPAEAVAEHEAGTAGAFRQMKEALQREPVRCEADRLFHTGEYSAAPSRPGAAGRGSNMPCKSRKYVGL